jgi:hypothetical protein
MNHDVDYAVDRVPNGGRIGQLSLLGGQPDHASRSDR